MFEGLPATVIDAVALRHIAAMSSVCGIKFNLVAFACTSDIWLRSQERLSEAQEIANCDITLLRGYRPSMPGSVWLNSQQLVRKLGRSLATFDFIHARTDYSTAVAGELSAIGSPRIIWDCRGDTHAEIYDACRLGAPLRHRLLAPLRYVAAERHRRTAVQVADGAIFVSEALRRLQGTELRANSNVLVAPNCADEDLFFVSSELRDQTRLALGVGQEETLFVYSGGISSYQRIEDTMDWFAALGRQIPTCRLLILTPEVDVVRTMSDRLALPNLPLIHCTDHKGVNAYLNAADAAFMLRHRNATNNVASPTKFAEYCMTGLPIVMSNAVPSAFASAQRFGNYVAEDEVDPMQRIAEIDRSSVAARASTELGRKSQIQSISGLYHRVVSPTGI